MSKALMAAPDDGAAAKTDGADDVRKDSAVRRHCRRCHREWLEEFRTARRASARNEDDICFACAERSEIPDAEAWGF